MFGWYRVYSRFYKIARDFYRLQKSLRFSIPAVRPAFKYFATNSHTRFSYINIRCCNLTSITDFFSLFVLLFEAHFFSLVPHFIFYRESFSFFLSTKLIPWYKSFFWFLCIKALLSPPLLGRQPNLFVKRSLNLDSYLFSCAWKYLSISFVLSPFASTFIFFFSWKILSIRRIRMLSGANGVFFSCFAAWITNIFLCVKISLCSRFSPVIYYRFIVAASIYIILLLFSFLFIFSWKLLLFYI